MTLMMQSFWRAVKDIWHPRMLSLTLMPLLALLIITGTLAWLYWGQAVAALTGWLSQSAFFSFLGGWMGRFGAENLPHALAILILVFAGMTLLVVASLILVSWLLTPVVVRGLAKSRFPDLERCASRSTIGLAWYALKQTTLALLVLILSAPLWLTSPLILVIPPLVWGWLTAQVLSYDVLSLHASAHERRALLRRYHSPLLIMGVACGYLSLAPSVVWISATFFALAFFVLIPVAIWIYTLIFTFSSLWFAHYLLTALRRYRQLNMPHFPANGELAVENSLRLPEK